MKKVSVNEVENGMVLDRDVRGASGNILLNKGTTLSAAMGRRLKNWGISAVFIQGEEEAVEQELVVETSPTEIREQLETKFADYLDNPKMHELFTAVFNYKSKQRSE